MNPDRHDPPFPESAEQRNVSKTSRITHWLAIPIGFLLLGLGVFLLDTADALILLACLFTGGLPCVVFRHDNQSRVDAVAGLLLVEFFAFFVWLVLAEGASIPQALWVAFGMGVLYGVLVLVCFAIALVILPIKDQVRTGAEDEGGL